jgi:hypothetical protein
VKIIEQKCARLMTLLKPSYQRGKLDLPVPPIAKSLASYPLQLNRTPISESIVEDSWKKLLLRARRKCRDILSHRSQQMMQNLGGMGGTGGVTTLYGDAKDVKSGSTRTSRSNSQGSEVSAVSATDAMYAMYADLTESQIVLACIVEQVVEWAQDEYKQRLLRKISCVKDRLETIHRFRLQMIISLHERFVVSGHLSLDSQNSINSSSSWLFNSNPDLAYQKAVREKFPFLDLTEPVIFDTPAALNGKSGVLYVTLGYALFYSPGTLFMSGPEIVVFTLRAVVLLGVITGDGTRIQYTYPGNECLTPPRGGSLSNLAGLSASSPTDPNSTTVATTAATGGTGSDGGGGTDLLHLHEGIGGSGGSGGGGGSSIVIEPTSAIGSSGGSTSAMAYTAAELRQNNSTGGGSIVIHNSGGRGVTKIVPGPFVLSSVRLVDCTGSKDATFEVSGGLTPDFSKRVADLIDLIIKVRVC